MKNARDLEKRAKEFLNDGSQEAWEQGELGRDVKHMNVAPDEVTKKFIEAKKIHSTSIRFPLELTENLRFLAKRKGLSYQTYLKMILTEHINREGRQ